MHNRLQIMLRTQPEFIAVRETLQHDQRLGDAGPPERDTLGGHRDRERVGAVKERRGGQHAVAVGIRLDHSHDPARRRMLPDPAEVVPECLAVDPDRRGALPVAGVAVIHDLLTRRR